MMSAKLAMFLAKGQAGLRPQDVFATSLYTGNGATQTITNGINLSGEGGLVWVKSRASTTHGLWDTLRGAGTGQTSANCRALSTASTADQTAVVVSDNVDYVHAFNSNGFSVTANTTTGALRALCNTSGVNYASWTFRRAPKFFDVVTWTGNGSNPRTISHSLGVAPGMIIIKATNQVNDWYTFHRSAGATQSLSLNQTAIAETGTSIWGSTLPGSSSFTVGNSNSNASGITYVAYLFAHDTDSSGIVQCGSFTTTSGVTDVTLGWRPQFVIIKDLNNISNWQMIDTTRQWDASAFKRLLADNSGSEFTSSGPFIGNSSTGFNMDGSVFGSGRSHIYLAIREPT